MIMTTRDQKGHNAYVIIYFLFFHLKSERDNLLSLINPNYAYTIPFNKMIVIL